MRVFRATGLGGPERGIMFLIRGSKGSTRPVVVCSDGYVGPDGRGGWAFIARGDGLDARDSGPLENAASHMAEWTAMGRALAWAEAELAPGDALELRTDSALVAKGLASRRPEMSGEAATLRAACRQALARLAAQGVRAKVARVRREENEEADALAREAARRIAD